MSDLATLGKRLYEHPSGIALWLLRNELGMQRQHRAFKSLVAMAVEKGLAEECVVSGGIGYVFPGRDCKGPEKPGLKPTAKTKAIVFGDKLRKPPTKKPGKWDHVWKLIVKHKAEKGSGTDQKIANEHNWLYVARSLDGSCEKIDAKKVAQIRYEHNRKQKTESDLE